MVPRMSTATSTGGAMARDRTCMTSPAMPDLVVWVSEPAVVCARVLALLDKRGYEYRKVQVTTDEDRVRMFEETGRMSCPLVVAGGVIVGGFAETDQADRSGRLRELLQAA
jgi:glutaredoxin